MSTQTNRDSEFYDRLKVLLGGYCWSQDGGNGGYDYDDIRCLIQERLSLCEQETRAKCAGEVRKKIYDRVNDFLGEKHKDIPRIHYFHERVILETIKNDYDDSPVLSSPLSANEK